jgi:uncharacterized protein YjbI with pentapeptide repeats
MKRYKPIKDFYHKNVPLKVILKNHKKWLKERKGEKADLIGVDLSGADLSEAYLRGADMIKSNLSAINLEKANLSKVNLFGANLNSQVKLRQKSRQKLSQEKTLSRNSA